MLSSTEELLLHFDHIYTWNGDSGLELCLQVTGQRVRLFGLDAPEKAQLCSDQDGKSYACGMPLTCTASSNSQHLLACEPAGGPRLLSRIHSMFTEIFSAIRLTVLYLLHCIAPRGSIMCRTALKGGSGVQIERCHGAL